MDVGAANAGLMGAGLMGLQRGYQTVSVAANEIAQQTTVNGVEGGGADLARPMVNLGVGERTAEAAVNVIRTADDMVGTLIDVMA